MKIYFTCEIKTASRCHQVTVNKWVIVIEPNNLNDWFIEEQNTMRSEMQNCARVAVFGIVTENSIKICYRKILYLYEFIFWKFKWLGKLTLHHLMKYMVICKI